MKYLLLLSLIFLVGCQLEVTQNEIYNLLDRADVEWESCFTHDQGVIGTVKQGLVVKSYQLNNNCESNITGATSKSLLSFSCQDKQPAVLAQTCANSCTNGKCIAASTCSDSDTGDIPFQKGEITITDPLGNIEMLTDICYPNNQLGELFCKSGDEIGFKKHTCIFGCRDGQCLQERFFSKSNGDGKIDYSVDAKLQVVPQIVATGNLANVVLKVSGTNLINPVLSYDNKSTRLFDDGFHQDALAEDNIYSTNIKITEPGLYSLTVQDRANNPILDLLQQELQVILPSKQECHNLINNQGAPINIVIVAVGYQDELFNINEVIDYEGDDQGLFSVEPFRSNKESFNIWYVLEQDYLGEANYDNGLPSELKTGFEMITACNKKNQFNLIVFDNQKYSHHDQLGYGTVGYSYALHNPTNPPVIALHEFVHGFSELQDEYDQYLIGEDIGLGQCYQTDTVDCSDNICVETVQSYQDCLEKSPWSDMIGDGCGKEGVLDCAITDPNHDLEVNCFLGCGGKQNLYRSNFANGMRDFKAPFRLGKVNEKIVCERIKEFDNQADCSEYIK